MRRINKELQGFIHQFECSNVENGCAGGSPTASTYLSAKAEKHELSVRQVSKQNSRSADR